MSVKYKLKYTPINKKKNDRSKVITPEKIIAEFSNGKWGCFFLK